MLKVLNCGCGCVAITAVAGVADATMRIAVVAVVNFFLCCTKYSICIYKCYNCQIHIIYHI